jgi:hypothetical protein
MPSGVILSSSSIGAKKEDVENVLTKAGLEVEQEEVEATEVPAEPARDDFDSEEAFEEAHVAWQDAQPKPKEEDDEDDEEDEAPAPKQKVSKFKRRIEKVVGPIKRENEELKRRLEALEKGGKKEDDKPAPEANPRPKKADFKTDEEYEDALLQWGVTKATTEDKAKDAVKKQQTKLNENLKSYQAAVEEFKDTHDDWDEVVDRDDIPMHPGVQLTIMNPDAIPNPAQVIYYLGKHPEYARKLAEKDVEAAIAEVGRLSDRLLKTESGSAGSATGRSEKPKPKHRAPSPIRPVSTAATSSTLTSADAAKKRDYKAFKVAQRAGR